jgi:hypothetical protein
MKNINSFTFCVINKKTKRVKFRIDARYFTTYSKYIAFYRGVDYNMFYVYESRFNIKDNETIDDFSVFVEISNGRFCNDNLSIKGVF